MAEEVRSLDQPARAQLRKYGVRFGAFNIYFPTMLKPACAELATVLWALKHGAEHGVDLAAMPELPRPGLTSVPTNPGTPEIFYRVAGYHVCGPRAVRVDMLERLADLIRVLLSWRADPANTGTPPKGATGTGSFRATADMMSILGCSSGELGNVLKALGFWPERRRIMPSAAAGEVPQANGKDGPAATAAPDPDDGTVQQAAEPPAEAVPVAAEIVAGADAEQGEKAAETPAAEPAAQPEPFAAATTSPAAPMDPPASAATTAATEQWEEIWRPRRRGRAVEGAEHGKRAPDRPRPAHRPPQEAKGKHHHPQKGKDRPRRPDRRRGPGERPERPRMPLHASPPPKAGADPDSPFAALSSLKAALEKRSQD